ncbi:MULTISPECIES: hypothetical protein [unclassified Ruegeria]|nr:MULTISPECIES: hypothetical protein [unclassified Ruegeria]
MNRTLIIIAAVALIVVLALSLMRSGDVAGTGGLAPTTATD